MSALANATKYSWTAANEWGNDIANLRPQQGLLRVTQSTHDRIGLDHMTRARCTTADDHSSLCANEVSGSHINKHAGL